MSTLDLFEFALCLALLAVTWAVVLVDEGMLLEPVQRWVRGWHQRRYMVRHLVGGDPESGPVRYAANTEQLYWRNNNDLDNRWWWKPLWGCYKCNAGWWGLLGYPLRCYLLHAPYSPWQHLLCVCATIFLACLLNKLYNWSSQ